MKQYEKKILLSVLPEAALLLFNDKGENIPFYNGKPIKEIYKFKDVYRINTNKGQYRVKDAWIDII